MIGKKITVLQDLHGEKIQSIIKNTIHTFVRKFNKVKPENKRSEGKKAEVPSSKNIVCDASNSEEGLNYHLSQKSLNYPALSSPFILTS